MERRVIKFNLMGAIGILLLIIAAIVGITIFATNKNNTGSKEKKDENEPQQQQIQENQDSYKEADMKETVNIDGQDTEIIVEPFESELKYKMNLPSEKFYFEGNSEEKDIFKSLESDSILMEIYKTEGGFSERAEELRAGQAERIKNNETYRMNALALKEDSLYYVEHEKRDNKLYYSYYVEGENCYYTIDVQFEEQFSEQIIPVVLNMIKSFEIM